jgi:signal transduction histidine kinase
VTLTNRLTLFFLTALALVLVAFSVALYTLARTHLFAQLNDRAAATLDTLVAAAEVEGDGLEWELHSRRLRFPGDGPPVWAVFDEDGHRLDGTPDPPQPLDPFAETDADDEQGRTNVTWGGAHWRIVRRTLRHPTPEAVQSTPDRPRYKSLVFVTAWPVAPVHELLNTLAWSLAGVSLALGVAAGVTGRWVCRRALAPVTRMTEAAGRMTSAGQGRRLPLPGTRDELHALATAFNALLARLQDSFERQRRFTGEASHQLRTPLTAMLGQMEVALRREREPEEYRRALSSAVSQAGRLRDIVEMLLFLARADAEARMPDLVPVELAAWLPEHVAATWTSHPRYHELSVVVPQVSAVVRAQPALLGQAVDNLIDNALKYSEPGTPVVVRVEVDAGGTTVCVEDRGRGMTDEDMRQVFQPFYRTSEVRRAGIGGVGLGLAVTARIASAFGAVAEVGTLHDGESRFTIRFPAPGQVQS